MSTHWVAARTPTWLCILRRSHCTCPKRRLVSCSCLYYTQPLLCAILCDANHVFNRLFKKKKKLVKLAVIATNCKDVFPSWNHFNNVLMPHRDLLAINIINIINLLVVVLWTTQSCSPTLNDIYLYILFTLLLHIFIHLVGGTIKSDPVSRSEVWDFSQLHNIPTSYRMTLKKENCVCFFFMLRSCCIVSNALVDMPLSLSLPVLHMMQLCCYVLRITFTPRCSTLL